MLVKNLDNMIEKVIKLLMPIIFFLPLFISSDFYFPFIGPRNFLFRIMVTVILGLYLFLFIRQPKKYKPLKSNILVAYLVLAFILTVSSLINRDFLFSFWSNYERMDGLVTLYHLLAFFVVILGLYYRKKGWLLLLRTTVFVSFLVSFVALGQFFNFGFFFAQESGRVSAFFGNPAYLATYALFHFFFALYFFLKERLSILRFELVSFYILDILLIFSLFSNIVGSDSNIFSFLKNFMMAMFFIIPQIFLNINCYYQDKKIKKISSKYYFLVIAFLNFLAIFYSQTRGVIVGLGLAVLFVLFFLLLSKKVSTQYKRISALSLLLLLVMTTVFFVSRDSKYIQQTPTLGRIASISINDTTTQSRILTWSASLHGLVEKPVLGWGEENYYKVFNKYFPTEILRESDSRVWFDRPHNIFIQYAISGGLLGLLAYLSIFIFAFKSLYLYYKKTNDIQTFLLFSSLIIAYLVQNFFVFDSLNSYIPLVLFLAIIIFISHKENKINFDLQFPKRRPYLPAILVFILVISLGVYLTVPRAMANRNFFTVFSKMRYQDVFSFSYQNHLDFIEHINKYYLGKFEGRQLYGEYVENLLSKDNIYINDRQKALNLAEEQLLLNWQSQPASVRSDSFLINLYLKAGYEINPLYNQKNIDFINKVLPYSPSRTRLYYALGNSYIGVGNYPEAVAQFERARDMSPYIFESYFHLLVAYLYAGDLEAASQLVAQMEENLAQFYTQVLKNTPLDADIKVSAHLGQLADVYVSFAYLDEGIDLLEESLIKYPAQSNFLAKLALYYHQLGQEEKSAQYLGRLRVLDPLYAEEIKKLYLK
ncbi:O-antigen ligase family protein [Patescibacteria group bacterium]|nr:O-antigen ligase family protein [Patescibacteria group bacterium]